MEAYAMAHHHHLCMNNDVLR